MSNIKTHRIVGYFKDAKGEKVAFSREAKATSKKQAIDTVKQKVGSQHRVKRHLIKVTSIDILDV